MQFIQTSHIKKRSPITLDQDSFMLKIVPDNSVGLLENLQAQLEPLTKRKERWYSVFWWLCVFFQLTAFVGSGYGVYHFIGTKYSIAICPLGLVLYILFGLLVGFLDGEYEIPLFNFFYGRTSLYSQVKDLKEQIELLTLEKENEIVRRIEKSEGGILSRKAEMLAIEEKIKYKRKWRSEYDLFPKILDKNRKLDEKDISLVREKLKLVRSTHPKYSKLHRITGKYFGIGYLDYHWLEWRLKRLMAWEAPEYVPRTYAPPRIPRAVRR